MIEMKNIVKKYPGMERPAVDKLSLEIKEGETCVFLGPSGCGKTTTLKMINRIIEPTSGEIYVDGVNIMDQDPDELRKGIGYVIQNVGLFPHLTVYDNIATVPRLLNWDEEKNDDRVRNLLEMVGLDPEENISKYPNALSGGQRQRVGVARALAGEPPVMLMDEPFSAVDPVTRTQLQDEFIKIQRKLKKTICFVTHDINEAIKMGDRIAIIDKGSLVQFDTPENILLNPANQFVRDFVGSDRSLKVLSLINVKKVMKEEIKDAKPNNIKISLDSTIKEAMSKMLELNISTVSVVDEKEDIRGYVGMHDIQRYIGRAYDESGQEETSDINVNN